jgi:hypothetical protein
MSKKEWNTASGNWEIDGIPVTYRVSWKSMDDGEQHTREFTDVDQGYDFYEDMQKSAHSYAVTWEHIPW